ncbi:hypothetical protein [Aeromicrobium sp. UC242_57]|uniref:hypothetical protein n=1 Tax=Aeromicrobium sp. UC242_57 TaxID=3374624 RepID=UPI003796C9D3
MGHGEATEGHGLVAMQAAFRIASHEAWEKIRTFATEQGLSTETLGHLGDALFAYIEHLAEQAQLGFDGATRAIDRSPDLARTRLIDAILEGATPVEIRTHASKANWPLPGLLVVVTVEPPSGQPAPLLTDLNPKYLLRTEPGSVIIVASARDLDELLDHLTRHAGESRVAKAGRCRSSSPPTPGAGRHARSSSSPGESSPRRESSTARPIAPAVASRRAGPETTDVPRPAAATARRDPQLPRDPVRDPARLARVT